MYPASFLISFFFRIPPIIMSPGAPMGCDSFRSSACVCWPQQFWVAPIRQSVDCPSLGICIMFSSWLGWATGYQGELRGTVLLKAQYQVSMTSAWLVTVALAFTGWGNMCFPAIRSPLPYCTPWKEVALLRYLHVEGRPSYAPAPENRVATDIICSNPVSVVCIPPLFIYWISDITMGSWILISRFGI